MKLTLRLAGLLFSVVFLIACQNTSHQQDSPRSAISSNAVPESLSSTIDDKPELPFPQSLAVLPFYHRTVDESVQPLLRQAVFGQITNTNYRYKRIRDTDHQMVIYSPNTRFVPEEAISLTQTLGVDAVLMGEIIDSSVMFAGIASQVYFEVEVKLVNSRGEVLWEDTFSERSVSGSISTDPISLIYGIVSSAQNIQDKNLYSVAHRLAYKIVEDMPQPAQSQSLPQNRIKLMSVVHDAADKVLRYGERIRVGIRGDSRKYASVKIEGVEQLFPLTEVADGEYISDILVSKDWNLDDVMLTGYLTDDLGGRGEMLSTIGLLNVDNKAPEQPKIESAYLFNGLLKLVLKHSESKLRTNIVVSDNDGKIISSVERFNSEIVQLEVASDEFESFNIEVVQSDVAGNVSKPVTLSVTSFPDIRMSEAERAVSRKLPAMIDRDTILLSEHSPYIATGTIIVNNAAKLFVGPNTQIQFDADAQVIVNGGLSVWGSGRQKVVFEFDSQTSSDKPMLVIDTIDVVSIKGLTIRNASIGILMEEGSLTFEDSSIVDSQFSSMNIRGSSAVYLKRCHINGSHTSGLVVSGNSKVNIVDSLFENNTPFHIQSSSIYPVQAKQNEWLPEADFTSILGQVEY